MIFSDLKCLFFDVGYTLVNEDEVWKERCIEQARTDEAKVLGLSSDDIFAEIVLASCAFLPQYRSVVKKFNFKQIAPYRHKFEKLYDGVSSMLEKLSQKYVLGIIANQEDGLSKRLDELDIKKYFKYIVSSWDYKVMKPDTQLFKIALQQAKCLPQEAVMIGDRLDNDIAPAKLIGMKTVWVKQGFAKFQEPKDDSFIADFEIDSLDKILAIL